MFDFKKPFGLASAVLLISALLHVTVIAASLGGYLVPMILGAIFWLAVAFGLQLGSRWFAMIAFLFAAFGGTLALGYGMNETEVVSLLFLGIAAVDWAASLLLFGALWRNPVPSRTS